MQSSRMKKLEKNGIIRNYYTFIDGIRLGYTVIRIYFIFQYITEDIKNEIITTSINYNLISRHTSFLSVDSLERTKGDQEQTINVPVPLPDGTGYDIPVVESFNSYEY